jgi:hypothetical protein
MATAYPVPDLFGACNSVVWIAGAACCGWASYCVAARWWRAAPASVRWCAGFVIACASLIVVARLLGTVGGFNLTAAAAAAAILMALAHWRLAATAGAPALLRQDARCAQRTFRALRRFPERWLLAAGVAIIGARVLRGLVAPPLAWDSLTYHLVKSARWIQYGVHQPFGGPDAWTYYDWFPEGGDILWAWAMLPMRGDGMLAVAGTIIWMACGLAMFAFCRELGAGRRAGLAAATAIAFTPAVANYLASAYVENIALAAFLCGGLFLARAWRDGARPDILLAAASFGLAASVKTSFLPVLALAILLVLAAAARAGQPGMPRALCAAGVLAVVAASLPDYLRAWIGRGSPLYPFALTIGGQTVIAGNRELLSLLSGERLAPDLLTWDPPRFLYRLFLWPAWRPDFEHLNLGPLMPFGLMLGVVGAFRLLRRRETRVITTTLLLLALVATLPMFAPGAAGVRAMWWNVIGRFLMPGTAVLLVFAATLGGRYARFALLGVAVGGMFFAVPRGWRDADQWTLRWLAAICLATGLVAWLAWRPLRRDPVRGGRTACRRRSVLRFAIWFAALFVVLVYSNGIRGKVRYGVYHSAERANARAFDLHPLDREFVSAWRVWRALDTSRPLRIAVTAGYAASGHNWFVYPLFGSRLQNRVEYVSPARDGAPAGYAEGAPDPSRLDFEAWWERLVSGRYDYVVTLAPAPVEARWMEENPNRFKLAATSSDSASRAYRVVHRLR